MARVGKRHNEQNGGAPAISARTRGSGMVCLVICPTTSVGMAPCLTRKGLKVQVPSTSMRIVRCGEGDAEGRVPITVLRPRV